MSAKIIRGQSINWPMAFWQDDAETVVKDCTGATLSVVQNTTGAVINAVWTNIATGKAKLTALGSETLKMKPGRFGTFRVKLSFGPTDETVYPNTDILVE